MTGEIIIRPGHRPEGLPEDMQVMSFEITGNAELSDFERIAVMYNLGMALAYGDTEWEMLRALAAHEPPFDELTFVGLETGGTWWEEDDGEDD